MPRHVVSFALMLVLAAAVGCAKRAPELVGAHFPIPSYPGAELEDKTINGATVEGDDGAFHVLYFEMKTPDNFAQIIQYYQKQLPQAVRSKTDERSEYAEKLSWRPPDAEKGEEVDIFIKDNKIFIAETVRPQKHKR